MGKMTAGPVIAAVGMVVLWVGYAMWRHPHLDWEVFTKTGWGATSWMWTEASRMVQEPFSCLGVLVMVGAGTMLLYGLWQMRVVLLVAVAIGGVVLLMT